MNVRFTHRAYKDREEILEYVWKHSPAGARKVFERFESVVQLLSEQPAAGIPTDRRGVRVLFVGRYPYRFFYRIEGASIEILHIRHTSMLPPR